MITHFMRLKTASKMQHKTRMHEYNINSLSFVTKLIAGDNTNLILISTAN